MCRDAQDTEGCSGCSGMFREAKNAQGSSGMFGRLRDDRGCGGWPAAPTAAEAKAPDSGCNSKPRHLLLFLSQIKPQ